MLYTAMVDNIWQYNNRLQGSEKKKKKKLEDFLFHI